MRRPLILTLLAIPLLLVPAVLAEEGALTGATAIEVTPAAFREGDLLRYDSYGTWEREDGSLGESNGTRLLHVEPSTRVLDRYGIPRDVNPVVVEHRVDEEIRHAFRCHVLAGGNETVRVDLLAGQFDARSGESGGSTTIGVVSSSWHESRATNFTRSYTMQWACGTLLRDVGTLREGDRLPYAAFAPAMDDEIAGLLSAPATSARFEGRDALAFTFDAADLQSFWSVEGHLTFLLAEGLPGVVQTDLEMRLTYDGRSASHAWRERLVGFEPGDGPALPADEGNRLPARNPDAEFAPFDPLVLDDAAFAPAYPYAEALRALREDARVGLDAWLDRNPEAWLLSAYYDRRDGRSAQFDTATETDGRWQLEFMAPSGAVYAAATARRHVASPVAPPPGAPAPSLLVENEDYGELPGDGLVRAPVFPDDVATSASLARVPLEDAAPVREARSIVYGAWMGAGDALHVELEVSEVGLAENEASQGATLVYDVTRGGIAAIGETTHVSSRTGILDVGGSTRSVAVVGATGAFSALAPPSVGAGIAAGSVLTGLALLAFAAKLALAPLYTRLVRDRLLDNPVRARLYDRVRAEPGIRLHELVEFAGVGEGATRRHLAQLARHGFIVEVREGAAVGHYAAGEVPPQVARQAAVLRSDAMRRVYELLREEPHLSLRDAAARLGISAPSVHRAKRKLEKAGLLPAAPEAEVARA